MLELIQITQGVLERGLIFGIIVMAVYIASRIINFDNLAVEGAFGLGGSLIALLISKDMHPWLALVIATCTGAISGIITGLITTKLKVNNLISGIVVTTGLFSIMLKIAGSNMSLHGKATIFSVMPATTGPLNTFIVLFAVCSILIICITFLLKTEIGFLLQAVGNSPQMLTNVGKSIDSYIITGLALSNALAALSGALFVQYTGYFSIWSGVGVLIIGLAGMILAHLLGNNFGFALIGGSIIYQAIIALTFEFQIDQDWNKLITALLIVSLMALNRHQNKK
jgi:putative ABC transport system permease protein